jgi:hypothetical protein
MNTQDQPIANLSGFENKTIVKPTGEAKTTTVNQTTVPFEKTIVEGGNQTGSQQQQPSQRNNQTGSQQQQPSQQNNQTGSQQQQPSQQNNQTGSQQQSQQQGNQSSGPLEKIGEKITDVFK